MRWSVANDAVIREPGSMVVVHGHELSDLTLERFWEKVNKTDTCWLWTGCKTSRGYGNFRLPIGKNIPAHRLSWMISRGPIPDGLFACHKCDVRDCVNPDHMFIGTQRENLLDMVSKGRNWPPENVSMMFRGEKSSTAKITESQALEVKQRLKDGQRQVDIGREMGISMQIVWSIKLGTSWKHVKLPGESVNPTGDEE